MYDWIENIITWFECLRVIPCVKDTWEGIPCEVEYKSKLTGNIVGYWAYGYYDPNFPYKPEASECKPKL